MKTIKLSILFLVQILLLSCSEQVYVDGTSKQVIKRDKMITQAISQLTPQNKLLVEEINKNVQDTILEPRGEKGEQGNDVLNFDEVHYEVCTGY